MEKKFSPIENEVRKEITAILTAKISPRKGALQKGRGEYRTEEKFQKKRIEKRRQNINSYFPKKTIPHKDEKKG